MTLEALEYLINLIGPLTFVLLLMVVSIRSYTSCLDRSCELSNIHMNEFRNNTRELIQLKEDIYNVRKRIEELDLYLRNKIS